jgi:hypothetical protein
MQNAAKAYVDGPHPAREFGALMPFGRVQARRRLDAARPMGIREPNLNQLRGLWSQPRYGDVRSSGRIEPASTHSTMPRMAITIHYSQCLPGGEAIAAGPPVAYNGNTAGYSQ